MNQSFARPILFAGALSLMGMPGGGIGSDVSKVHAAPWIAPAPHQELTAQWVKDVARELRNPEFRNILMNIPAGSPQSTILDLLNEAAIGLQDGNPAYARKLVRQAVNILDRQAGQGWLTRSDVQPIQAMILKHAKKGFSEADQQWKNRPSTRQKTHDRRFKQDRETQLFNPIDPTFSRNRWDGYTNNHRQGMEDIQSRNVQQNQSDLSKDRAMSRSYRNQENSQQLERRNRGSRSEMERGGTQRFYSDDFYYSNYPWEDRERSLQGDTRRSTSFRKRDNRIDQMPWSTRQDRRQHARGNERFYQERLEDSGQPRPFDRGPGEDRYYESTTRHESRGYDQ